MWGPVCTVDLRVEIFCELSFAPTSYLQMKVFRHGEVTSNERANALTEKSFPRNAKKGIQVQRMGTPIAISPPDKLHSPTCGRSVNCLDISRTDALGMRCRVARLGQSTHHTGIHGTSQENRF